MFKINNTIILQRHTFLNTYQSTHTMKLLTTITQKLLIMATIICMAGSAYGQSPDAFKYQAIARNNSGEPLVNQNVSFFIRILKGSESGTEVYAESHTATTNAFGLVNLELGKGSVVGSNSFPDIEWGSGSYFVEISLDPSGGTSYQALGISPLLAVPYAMHANTADSLTNHSDFDADPTNELQELSIKNDSLFISGGNGVLTDTDTTNELQNLSILNDSLFISGGNGVLTDTDTTNELQNLSIINDDFVYLNPFVDAFDDSNLFSDETRYYPIDLIYPFEEGYILNLTVPEDYEIVEYPESMNLKLPGDKGFLKCSSTQNQNKIQLRISIKFTDHFFYPNEYPYLKEIYDLYIEKRQEQIVLKKRT